MLIQLVHLFQIAHRHNLYCEYKNSKEIKLKTFSHFESFINRDSYLLDFSIFTENFFKMLFVNIFCDIVNHNQ